MTDKSSQSRYDEWESERDPKQLLQEAENLKRTAFFGVAIGTAAILTAVIGVPMLYNYMQFVQVSEFEYSKRLMAFLRT